MTRSEPPRARGEAPSSDPPRPVGAGQPRSWTGTAGLVLLGLAVSSGCTPSTANTSSPPSTPSNRGSSPSFVPSPAASRAAPAATGSATEPVQTFVDSRFGFRCQVPARLVREPPPENGDGQEFTSPDGLQHVTCSGINTPTEDAGTSPGVAGRRDRAFRLAHGATVTYSAADARSYTLSGLQGDHRVFYEHVLWGWGSQNTVLWTYPQAEKAALDAAVTRSVQTFRPGDLATTH